METKWNSRIGAPPIQTLKEIEKEKEKPILASWSVSSYLPTSVRGRCGQKKKKKKQKTMYSNIKVI